MRQRNQFSQGRTEAARFTNYPQQKGGKYSRPTASPDYSQHNDYDYDFALNSERNTSSYGDEGYRNRDRGYAGRDWDRTSQADFGRNFGGQDRFQNESYRPSSSMGNYEQQDHDSSYSRPYSQGQSYGPGASMNRGYSANSMRNDSMGEYSNRDSSLYGHGSQTYGSGQSYSQDRDFNAPHSQQQYGTKSQGRGPKGYKRSDERVKEDVCEALSHHGSIDATEVEVAVAEGVVTLTGTVESRQMKRLIEDRVESMSGVRDIKNEIRIDSTLSSSSYGGRSMGSDTLSTTSSNGNKSTQATSSKNSSSSSSRLA